MTTSTSENQNRDEPVGATHAPVFFAMTDVLRYSATAKDARFPLTEIFFESEKGLLRFVALDVGGWFDRREVIVSARLMGDPDESTREWPVEISPDAIRDAPEWSDPKVLDQMAFAAIQPSILVGPLGGHFSGLPAVDRRGSQDVPERPGNLKVDGLERLNDWVGLPVFGRTGEVGTLIDFLFEPETGHLSHLVVDTGGFFSARQMVVPYDLLRHLAKGGTHVVVNVTEKLLEEAPPLEKFDMLNRSWVDTLRAYYQLTPRL
jgi:sporulation protein YlmC with PRC-barrel domain